MTKAAGARLRLASPTTAVLLGLFELALLIVGLVLASAIHQLGLAGSQSSNVGLAFGLVGVVVAGRQPSNPMGWILLGAGGFLLLSGLAASYSVLDYRIHGGSLPLGPLAVLVEPTWAPAVVLFASAILVFPDGRLRSRRWRLVLLVFLAAGAAFQLGSFGVAVSAIVSHNIHVQPGGDLTVIDNPSSGYLWYAYVEGFFFIVLATVALAWLLRQVPAYGRSRGERRLQQKWFLSGATIFLIAGFRSLAQDNAKGTWHDLTQFAAIGLIALPISIGVGILKYRLYDIDPHEPHAYLRHRHRGRRRRVRRSHHSGDKGAGLPLTSRRRSVDIVRRGRVQPSQTSGSARSRSPLQPRPVRRRDDRRRLHGTLARCRRSRDGQGGVARRRQPRNRARARSSVDRTNVIRSERPAKRPSERHSGARQGEVRARSDPTFKPRKLPAP